jgi:protein-disulfide isomerase
LIEYGDFECPGCLSAHPRIKAITEQYKDELAFVFRNFPLTSIHPNARAAAAAAEAGGLQGKYWEMHNSVFEQQAAWKNQTGTDRTAAFSRIAESVGLDVTTFESDLGSTAIDQKIRFDQALAKKTDVQSTPTFFLGGVKLESDVWGDDAALKAAIDEELTKAGIALPEEK